MTPRVIRRIVLVVFVAGIAGMIAGSIADRTGVAITFGLVTAVAAVNLILVSAVAPPGSLSGRAREAVDEQTAAEVERRVRQLVDAGADEQAVRELVHRAVQLGRHSR